MKVDKKAKCGCSIRRVICGVLAALALLNGIAAIMQINVYDFGATIASCKGAGQDDSVQDDGAVRILCERIMAEGAMNYDQGLQVEALVSFVAFVFLMLYMTDRKKN
ncbi:MAG: hypothetical protein Q4B34_00110 [Candidatus Saccharibacteria bacterium]|nr:hypothetical protein [Candidatus Saccharibacteria bacterium]